MGVFIVDELKEIGEKLKLLRFEKDDSLEDVAKITGISKSLLSKYERGMVDPGLKALSKLVKYYNISLDWLFGFTDNRSPIDIVDPFSGLPENRKNEAKSFIQFLINEEKRKE